MVWQRQNGSNVKTSQEPAEGEVRVNAPEDSHTGYCDSSRRAPPLPPLRGYNPRETPRPSPRAPSSCRLSPRGLRLRGVEDRPPVLCRRVLTGSPMLAASLHAKNVRAGRPALCGAELPSLSVGAPAERPSCAQGSAVGVGRDVINTQT